MEETDGVEGRPEAVVSRSGGLDGVWWGYAC
jgi:hypothetical protein